MADQLTSDWALRASFPLGHFSRMSLFMAFLPPPTHLKKPHVFV